MGTNQRQVGTFDTIEDFWSLINYLEEPSGLVHGCDYSLFRKGIKPMWEDKANVKGGRWLVNIDDRKYTDQKTNKCKKLDHAWMEVMMCLVGEAFGQNGDLGKSVTGAVCSRREKKNEQGGPVVNYIVRN